MAKEPSESPKADQSAKPAPPPAPPEKRKRAKRADSPGVKAAKKKTAAGRKKKAAAKKRGAAAKPNGVAQIGDNIKSYLGAQASRLVTLKTERDAINADMNEIKANVKTKGVSKKAFNLAVQVKAMDAEDQVRFLESFDLACDALGVERQERLDV